MSQYGNYQQFTLVGATNLAANAPAAGDKPALDAAMAYLGSGTLSAAGAAAAAEAYADAVPLGVEKAKMYAMPVGLGLAVGALGTFLVCKTLRSKGKF